MRAPLCFVTRAFDFVSFTVFFFLLLLLLLSLPYASTGFSFVFSSLVLVCSSFSFRFAVTFLVSSSVFFFLFIFRNQAAWSSQFACPEKQVQSRAVQLFSLTCLGRFFFPDSFKISSLAHSQRHFIFLLCVLASFTACFPFSLHSLFATLSFVTLSSHDGVTHLQRSKEARRKKKKEKVDT